MKKENMKKIENESNVVGVCMLKEEKQKIYMSLVVEDMSLIIVVI